MAPRTPSYRLHKPTQQAVVTLNGRDFYLDRHGSPVSRSEYDRLIAEWLANGRQPLGPDGGPPDITVSELILAYWRHVEIYYVKGGSPTSEQDTIRQAMRFVRKYHGATPTRDFGPLALKAIRQAMIDHGWCRSYINKQINRVRLMFAWAAENEIVPVAAHQALKTVAGLRAGRSEAREKPPVCPVSVEHVEAVLPFVTPTVATMIRLQRLTGMRPQEVILMQAEDIDSSETDCWTYRPGRHKGEHHGRERLVFLGPQCQALLRPFLEETPSGYLFSPRRSVARWRAEVRARRTTPRKPWELARRPKPNPERTHGELYDDGAYRKAIRRACQRAGVPIWFPHQLRHSTASEIRKRFGLEASQAVLGHAELGVTQVYAEVDRVRAREIMREVG